MDSLHFYLSCFRFGGNLICSLESIDPCNSCLLSSDWLENEEEELLKVVFVARQKLRDCDACARNLSHCWRNLVWMG